MTWLYNKSTDGRLSGRALNEAGGLAGILSQNADAFLNRLTDAQRERALDLLLRLVRVDHEGRRHTRQRISRADAIAAAGGGAEGEDLLTLLAGRRAAQAAPLRLIVIGESTSGSTVSLIHETLIQSREVDADRNPEPYWPTLWGHIEANRQRELRRNRARLFAHEIADAAATWAAAGRHENLRWSEERFWSVLRELSAAGLAVKDVLVDPLHRAFFGPIETIEIEQLLKAGNEQDAAVGSDAYGAAWRLPLSHTARTNLGARLALLVKGDERHGVGLRDGLPDIDWCRIEGGEITLETELWETSEIAAFWISRYPVTVRQFDVFVNACYRGGKWILDGINTSRLGIPWEMSEDFCNYPAAHVSWYQAVAFCHWFSDRLGSEVRLPTEFEWQLAATGGDPSRAYPWGPYWNPRRQPWRANTLESGIWHRTAVGLYPLGTSPAGVMDMAGTVREWCLNPFGAPLSRANLDDRPRPTRGGSWFDGQDGARCANRMSGLPYFQESYCGFRVARSAYVSTSAR